MKKRKEKVKTKGDEKRIKRDWIFWTPRIVSIAFILFLTIFSLDVFEGTSGFWQIVLALLMHNLPSIVLLIVLLISWRHEIVGGIIFILAGALYTIISIVRLIISSPIEWYMLSWSLIIAGPAVFIGVLFLIGWLRKRKKGKRE